MGADFLERVRNTMTRRWDRQRVALATSDLFTRQPDCADRSVVGEIIGEVQIAAGEKLTVEIDGADLIARRGLTDVVKITKAPADVIRGIEESCGVGVGTVNHVYEQARAAEISIC